MVSAIIPAYNEGETVGAIIGAVLGHPKVAEIIVVDDGSSDNTAEVARAAGAEVIRLEKNVGKVGAMSIGVEKAKSDVILFLDADILGYDHAKISAIIDPVLDGTYEMFIGIRARGIFMFNRFAHFFPLISGERAMTRSLWDKIPKDRMKSFEIEIASNYVAKQTEKGMGFALTRGITHIMKEKKYGFWVGFYRRWRMVFQVSRISCELYIFNPVKLFFGRLLKAEKKV